MKLKLKMQIKAELAQHMAVHFREYRRKHDLTQDEFARMLGITSRSYSSLEKGEFLCSAVTFALYWTKYCEDPMMLLDELCSILNRHGLNPHSAADLHNEEPDHHAAQLQPDQGTRRGNAQQ